MRKYIKAADMRGVVKAKSQPVYTVCDPGLIAKNKTDNPTPWRAVWQTYSYYNSLGCKGIRGRWIVVDAKNQRVRNSRAAALRIVEAVNAHEHASVNN